MFKEAGKHMVLPGLIGIALAIAPFTHADEKPTAKKISSAAQTDKSATTSAAGLTVAKDPVTGALRAPTAEEAAALAAAAPTTPRVTTPRAGTSFDAPGGGTGIVTDDSATVFAVATRHADGSIAIGEVSGAAAAKAAGASTGKPTKNMTTKSGAVRE